MSLYKIYPFTNGRIYILRNMKLDLLFMVKELYVMNDINVQYSSVNLGYDNTHLFNTQCHAQGSHFSEPLLNPYLTRVAVCSQGLPLIYACLKSKVELYQTILLHWKTSKVITTIRVQQLSLGIAPIAWWSKAMPPTACGFSPMPVFHCSDQVSWSTVNRFPSLLMLYTSICAGSVLYPQIKTRTFWNIS